MSDTTERYYLVKTTGDLTVPNGAVQIITEQAVIVLNALNQKLQKPTQETASEKVIRVACLAAEYVRQRDTHSYGTQATYRRLQKACIGLPLSVRKANDPVVQQVGNQ